MQKSIISSLSKRQKKLYKQTLRFKYIFREIAKDAYSNHITSGKILLQIKGIYFSPKRIKELWINLNRLCKKGYEYVLVGFQDEKHTITFKIVSKNEKLKLKKESNVGLFIIDDPIINDVKKQDFKKVDWEFFSNATINPYPKNLTRWSKNDLCGKILNGEVE